MRKSTIKGSNIQTKMTLLASQLSVQTLVTMSARLTKAMPQSADKMRICCGLGANIPLLPLLLLLLLLLPLTTPPLLESVCVVEVVARTSVFVTLVEADDALVVVLDDGDDDVYEVGVTTPRLLVRRLAERQLAMRNHSQIKNQANHTLILHIGFW